MDHDHDVRPRLQGHPVAGLLVAAVTLVPFMDKHLRMGQTGGDGRGFITACVIHQDHQIHDPLLHNLVIGPLEGLAALKANMTFVSRHNT